MLAMSCSSSAEAFDIAKMEYIAEVNRKHEEYLRLKKEVEEMKKQMKEDHYSEAST